MNRIRLVISMCAVALFAAPALFAACTYASVPSPPVVHPLLVDSNFNDTNCNAWELHELAAITAYGAEISGDDYFEQEFYVDSDEAMELAVDFEVVSVGAVLDRMFIEFVDSTGGYLDTIGSMGRNASSGVYRFYPPNDYYGQNIKIRFASTHDTNGGTTVFRVKAVHLWVYN